LEIKSTYSAPPSKTTSSASSSVPTASHSTHSYGLHAPKKIQRQDLDSAKVLAQVDQKWIVCLLDRTLLLVDQHAADERVRLETMLDMDLDVRFLQPYLALSTTEHVLNLAMSHRKTLQHWGIHVETSGSDQQHQGGSPHFTAQISASPHFSTKQRSQHQLVITRLPHLILERCVLDPQLLSDLIHNYLNALEGRTLTSSVCPPGMMDMLKSKACRSK
jgi:DNA mismatch repair ATPase MutL